MTERITQLSDEDLAKVYVDMRKLASEVMDEEPAERVNEMFEDVGRLGYEIVRRWLYEQGIKE